MSLSKQLISLLNLVLCCTALLLVNAFKCNAFIATTNNNDISTPTTSTSLHMNWFNKALQGAFGNEEFAQTNDGPRATARHILCKSADEVEIVLDEFQNENTSFTELAQVYSACPSGKSRGGSLGSFTPGTMVPEFDKVVFDPTTPVGKVVGPVVTKFGYHLIVVDKRSE